MSRPRLSDRLSHGTDAKLTLVSAPAGFGKTTLLTAWLASAPQRERITAWVSLDQSDNNPTALWTNVMPHYRRSRRAWAPVRWHSWSRRIAPLELVVGTPLNELNALPNDLVLILDDEREGVLI